MENQDREEIRKLIEDTVESSLNKTTLPICQIEGARMAQFEKVVTKLQETVLGNGHIEGSLIWRQQKLEEAVVALKEIIDRRGKDKDPFSQFLHYFVDKILPSLITTAILGYIAFQWAVSQSIKP